MLSCVARHLSSSTNPLVDELQLVRTPAMSYIGFIVPFHHIEPQLSATKPQRPSCGVPYNRPDPADPQRCSCCRRHHRLSTGTSGTTWTTRTTWALSNRSAAAGTVSPQPWWPLTWWPRRGQLPTAHRPTTLISFMFITKVGKLIWEQHDSWLVCMSIHFVMCCFKH